MRFVTLVVLLLGITGCESILGPDVLVFEVAEARVPCMGNGPQECFLVRTVPHDEWQLHYGSIEGFDYEPGYRYRILVKRTEVRNPPADGSSLKYTLKSVESKVRSDRFDVVTRVHDAETQWRNHGPVTYSMILERVCECTAEMRGPVRLEVTRLDHGHVGFHENVLSRQYVSDGRAVPYEHHDNFHTVQGLFGEIRRAAAAHAHRIDVTYDATGYPRRISIDWHAQMADDEVEYIVRELTPR